MENEESASLEETEKVLPELINPEEVPGWIVFEDEDLLVVNKPGDIVCHPSKQGPWSSLVGACREYLQVETVHLVHRLDRETSGLVIMAKNKRAARLTQMAFQNRQVSKTYFAIVDGEMLEPVEVKNHLARDMESEVYIKQTVRKSNSAQRAETGFAPVCSGGGYTFVQVTPHTGRKHQIRAHAIWLGHPIVGDKIYGPDDTLYLEFIEHGWTPRLAAALPLRRQALHAAGVEFTVPEFRRTFFAPLLPDMEEFLREKLGIADPQALMRERVIGEAAGDL
jgi:23S rRNA pseudouridine1911/1915/1917 synthase